MSSDGMLYDKSNLSPGSGKPAPERGPQAPTSGPVTGEHADNLAYPSLSSEGRVEIELPMLNSGSSVFKVTKCRACDLGRFISRQVAAALGTGQAHVTLSHYAGACCGGKLLASHSQRKMDEMVIRLANSKHPKTLFETEVRPFLESLKPQAR